MSDRVADQVVATDLPIAEPLAAMPKVIADDCARLFWVDKDEWNMRTDVGPLRLPFPSMWIEWRMPRRVNDVDGRAQLRQFEQGATMLTEGAGMVSDVLADDSDVLKADHVFTALPVVDVYGKVQPLPYLFVFGVHEDGLYRSHCLITDDSEIASDHRERHEHVDFWVWPALIALGFMNCKNVTLSDPQPGTSRKVRARDGKRQKYQRIVLPGAPTTKAEANGSRGDPAALHVVRGHFKTYTEDAPLFGSKTGTYWWSHHARGKGEGGRGVPEYEVR